MWGWWAHCSGASTHLRTRLRLPGHPGPQSWSSLGPREGEEGSAGAKWSRGGAHGCPWYLPASRRSWGPGGVPVGRRTPRGLPAERGGEGGQGGWRGGREGGGVAGGTACLRPRLTFSPRAPFSPCEEDRRRRALAGRPWPTPPCPTAPPSPPIRTGCPLDPGTPGSPCCPSGPCEEEEGEEAQLRARTTVRQFLASIEVPGEDGDAHPGGQDLPVAL